MAEKSAFYRSKRLDSANSTRSGSAGLENANLRNTISSLQQELVQRKADTESDRSIKLFHFACKKVDLHPDLKVNYTTNVCWGLFVFCLLQRLPYELMLIYFLLTFVSVCLLPDQDTTSLSLEEKYF